MARLYVLHALCSLRLCRHENDLRNLQQHLSVSLETDPARLRLQHTGTASSTVPTILTSADINRNSEPICARPPIRLLENQKSLCLGPTRRARDLSNSMPRQPCNAMRCARQVVEKGSSSAFKNSLLFQVAKASMDTSSKGSPWITCRRIRPGLNAQKPVSSLWPREPHLAHAVSHIPPVIAPQTCTSEPCLVHDMMQLKE